MCPADPLTGLAETGNMKGSGMTRHHLVLADELQPHIGSGHRWVEAKIGYKWVFVRERTESNRKRIKRDLWDTLVTQTERYLARQEKGFEKLRKKAEKKND
jgi:hypothetical protein